MGTRKRTSELVFNLQWKTKPDNGGDKSNVIGMYDTPTTTSNFEMFKSYLLKNSGVAGNDVKVTYLTDDGQEWIIDSQDWFEIALSAFRLKARLGEVIYLKLDKISNTRHQMTRKHSNDVETQFDVDSMGNCVVAPPEWFVAYMDQFKKDVIDDITATVSANLVANSKDDKETVLQDPTFSKKPKPESSKRSRSHVILGEATPIDKELLRTLKFDRKLENKLDKLDAKTKKIKEKKQALMNRLETDEQRCLGKFSLISVEDDSGRHGFAKKKKKRVAEEKKEFINIVDEISANKDPEVCLETDDLPELNASVVGNTTTARMIGGEIYLHSWDVVNSGKLQWPSNTELRLTWGSADLVPSVKSMRCFPLQPGEKKTFSVRFEIPKKPGTYECYWNFYYQEFRFGHSLNCCIIVEEPLASILPAEYQHVKEKKNPLPKLITTPKEQLFASNQILKVLKDSPVSKSDDGIKPAAQPVIKNEETRQQTVTKNDDILSFNLLKQSPMAIPVNRDTEKENAKFQEILICPDGLKEGSKPFKVRAPKNLSRILYYTHGVNDSEKIVDVPLNTSPEFYDQLSEFEKKIIASYANESPLGEQKETKNVVEHPTPKEKLTPDRQAEISSSVMDLSRKIQDMKIAGSSHVDSDSDWESVWSYGKSKNIETSEFTPSKTNVYGIHEKDLVVDLSRSSEKNSVPLKIDSENTNGRQNEEKMQTDRTEDNNNNNGTLDNNHSSESISEVASEASSDLSSGYDVLTVPVCDEKEEDATGYVYITIDGNKLPVPRHILRPDFLADAEEAAGPLNSDEEEKIPEATVAPKASVVYESPICPALETQVPNTNENIQEQNHPGYEVVCSTCSFDDQQNETGTSPASKENAMQNGSSPTYTWAKSETQYCLSNANPTSPGAMRHDPYGPLDHAQPATCAHGNPTECNSSTPVPNYGSVTPPQTSNSHPVYAFNSFDELSWNQYMQQCQSQEHQHVPNYQQSVPKTCHMPPVNKQDLPSAPPQQRRPSEQSSGHGVPVHILPENLVNGAVNVASSAINTARSVINMIVPPKTEAGKWVNGHWVTENPESLRAKNLCILAEMGFWDMDLNATLLARYNDDIARVVSELIQ